MAYVLFALAGLGLVALVIGLLAVLLARPRRSRVAPPAADAVPTVEIVALGISGSGKTVFLASLFHELHVPLGGRPYFLGTDAEQRVTLSGVLREVSDPTLPWPPGTMVGQTRRFTFDCLSKVDDRWRPVLRLNYLDYAGEVLEHTSEGGRQALQQLETYVKGADAVLGMLDGRRIVEFMRGAAGGRTYLTAAIQPMLGIMAATHCPIYLVITKWDIVRGFGEPENADDNTRLDRVRDALLSLPQLRGLVNMRSIVRLIPVSAVGPDFATLDATTGRIDKRADGMLQPMNVEVPIAAVLPDLFRRVAATMDVRVSAGVDAQVREMMRLSPLQWSSAIAHFLTRPAGAAVRATLDIVLGRSYGSEVVGLLLDWMGRPYRRKGEQVAAFRTDAERQLAEVSQARIAIVEHFHKTMYVFEDRLPASRLWTR
ncbi:MAG TPA: hypothetical protein VFC00_34285 [Micromonosporaceae bacterium]|nr:hypothetical protein [Micromonosporaceae bacterium]